MTESHRARPAIRWRAIAAPCIAAACLTLLFAASDMLRRGPSADAADWGRALSIGAIDWGTWLLLVPLIVVTGRRVRLDAPGALVPRVAGWLALAALCCAAQSAMSGVLLHITGLAKTVMGGRPVPPLRQFLTAWIPLTAAVNLIIFAMIAGVFHAALYYTDLRARQLDEAALRERLAHAELGALRMQLQPHFLFNALHTVSSLMSTDVGAARRVIAALGDLLRAAIDHTALEEIPLGQEIAFLRRYVEIQQARFRHRLVVRIDTATDVLDALTPSLVLQPLVENAIRHGIEPSPDGGSVHVTATRDGDRLVLVVRDDGVAVPSQGPPGIGLSNVRARLFRLYGDAHDVRAGPAVDGGFEVRLSLPYRTATHAPRAVESVA